MSKKKEKEAAKNAQILSDLRFAFEAASGMPDPGMQLVMMDNLREKAEKQVKDSSTLGMFAGMGTYVAGYSATMVPLTIAGDLIFGAGLPVVTFASVFAGVLTGKHFENKKRDKILAERAPFIAEVKAIEEQAVLKISELSQKDVMSFSASPALPEIFTRFPQLKEKFVAAQACKMKRQNPDGTKPNQKFGP